MKELLGIDIDARELVRGFGLIHGLRERAHPISSEELGLPIHGDDVRVVWPKSKGLSADLPSILLGSDSVLNSVLPKMLALPGAIMPVTSLMKVWLIEDLQDSQIFREKQISDLAALGFVGLIIGELIATIGPGADLRLMGMDGVRRTLSFVCAQAIKKGWQNERLATVVEHWLEASELTANDVNVPEQIQIANICGFLHSLANSSAREDYSPSALAYRVQQWVEAQNGSNQNDLLRFSLPEFAHSLAGVGSREKRYDMVVDVLDQSSSKEMRDPLAQGFLLSLIEPGSFDFVDLARRVAPSGGSVVAAYCACAAILGEESALRGFNGFGWTVLNQGIRPNVETPMDISLTELRILNHTRRSAPIPFRTRSPWLVDVELAPMVVGSFGNVAKRRTSIQRTEQEADASERDEMLRENLAQAMRALESAVEAIEGRRGPKEGRASAPRRYRR